MARIKKKKTKYGLPELCLDWLLDAKEFDATGRLLLHS
jgi:hypothetical protein